MVFHHNRIVEYKHKVGKLELALEASSLNTNVDLLRNIRKMVANREI